MGEVIHPRLGGAACVDCAHASDSHTYVVVSDTKMMPTGCDAPICHNQLCTCKRYRTATIADGPPSREETWKRYPNDALEILKAKDSPTTRCGQAMCHAPIWWGLTAANHKRCPFDIRSDGERTGTSHWRTCRDRPA